jgi:hypothetical protein
MTNPEIEEQKAKAKRRILVVASTALLFASSSA